MSDTKKTTKKNPKKNIPIRTDLKAGDGIYSATFVPVIDSTQGR